MKSILIILLTTLLTYPASGLAKTLTQLELYIEKLTKVVAKSELCIYAVADVPKNQHQEATYLFPKSVRCIGDVTVNPGTMKEVIGCAAFFLDGSTLRLHPFFNLTRAIEKDLNIIKDKGCLRGGAELLLSQKTIYGSPVVNFFSGTLTANDMFELKTVYQSSDFTQSMKSLIESSKSDREAKKLAEKKKEEGQRIAREQEELKKKAITEKRKLKQNVKENKSKALYE
jgi:hypothetical protein